LFVKVSQLTIIFFPLCYLACRKAGSWLKFYHKDAQSTSQRRSKYNMLLFVKILQLLYIFNLTLINNIL